MTRRDARVLIYSQRNNNLRPWMLSNYEFEDVIAEVDDVDVVSPAERAIGRRERLAVRLRGRLTGHRWHRFVPHVHPMAVDRDYDLFFSVFQYPYQLSLLSQLRDWRRRCRTAVCFIIELWRPSLEQYAQMLPILNDFDHVFIVNAANLASLARRTTARCGYLPFAVDAERFAPYPAGPERVIDWYSYGRRSPGVHAALLELAKRERQFYLYDTMPARSAYSYRDHRRQLVDVLQRARYVPAFRVNANPERLSMTGGEEGLVMRYFEGAAAGAVLLGNRPQCAEHDECFDWPDSTIDMAFDGSDVWDVAASLDAQPDRVDRIRRDNVVHSLRRHDWLYRWQRVLDAAGLAHTPAMAARAERLERLAALVADAGAVQPVPRLARV